MGVPKAASNMLTSTELTNRISLKFKPLTPDTGQAAPMNMFQHLLLAAKTATKLLILEWTTTVFPSKESSQLFATNPLATVRMVVLLMTTNVCVQRTTVATGAKPLLCRMQQKRYKKKLSSLDKTMVIVLDGSWSGNNGALLTNIKAVLTKAISDANSANNGWFTNYVGIVAYDTLRKNGLTYQIVYQSYQSILQMAKAAMKKADAAGDSDAPKKVTKKVKKPKDGPKRAMSAYNYWFAENRPRIAETCSGPEVMKAAGAEWKTVEDKSKWEKLAADDKKRFQDESAS
uniref:HMG box domain-containing protein n=2 Tax=Ditylenchus dipsaci TaxID=166011 RepID=A0A915DAA7_9BILA